jgi:cytochrome P450
MTRQYSVCTVSLFYSRKASLKWIRQLPNSGLIHIYDIIFGRSCMLICSHAAMLEVLSNTSDYEKPYGLRQFLSGVLGNGLVAAEEGAIHRQDRRLQSPAFTAKNVRQLHSVIWAQTTILLQQIQTKAEEHPRPVDIIDWMQ